MVGQGRDRHCLNQEGCLAAELAYALFGASVLFGACALCAYLSLFDISALLELVRVEIRPELLESLEEIS